MSLYKLLIYRIDIITRATIFIKTLSKEAIVVRHHNEIRYIRRKCHSRNSSRENCNKNLYNLLIINYDTSVSKHRK